MLKAAEDGGGRCFVGLQGRLSPIVQTVKALITSDQIGKVLSSTVTGAVTNGGGVEGKGVRYFVDRRVGGNMYTIAFAHRKFPVKCIAHYPKYCSIGHRAFSLRRVDQLSLNTRKPTAGD